MRTNKFMRFWKNAWYRITYPFVLIRNYIFCLRYPFWTARNVWDGRKLGYRFTQYDQIPCGWRKAFGKQLTKDIAAALRKAKANGCEDPTIHWQDIKEKWGCLCLYASAPQEVMDVLERYEDISGGYCISCGKPAEYMTKGYILPFCERCFDGYVKEHEYTRMDKKECKIKDEGK